ncbi:MAG: Fur family transcriptional regulator [Segniliparus sp.]|uniref:Fur family transcriptional regulator n=1 Tax=Segniliparus sp. TaxID=2804064 RepID=UPI003F2F2405
MSTTHPPARQSLVDAGLRVTAPRVAVLETLASAPHATADQIASEVRARLGTVSTQAIYDALRTFEENGLVRRIEPAGSPARYETRAGDNHHHLVCRKCGKVADVDCVVGHAPCLEPAHDAGYVLDEAEVVFWGVCPECQHAAAQQTSLT